MSVSETAANTPYMLLPEENGYLLKPDAPILSAAMPRIGSVTASDSTNLACHVGTYEATADVASLLSALGGKDGYLYYIPQGMKLEPSASSPALLPYEASLVVAGERDIANSCFELCLDGLPTGIKEEFKIQNSKFQDEEKGNGQSSNCKLSNCQIYDLGGRRLSSPKLGVNIIHTQGGTARKVLAK